MVMQACDIAGVTASCWPFVSYLFCKTLTGFLASALPSPAQLALQTCQRSSSPAPFPALPVIAGPPCQAYSHAIAVLCAADI